MKRSSTGLGACPRCGRALAEAVQLIEYESADGTRRCFAECSDCDAVVKPE